MKTRSFETPTPPTADRDPLAVGRPGLRILFFVDRPGLLRQYASLLLELAERGHTVHLAFSRARRKGEGKLVRQATGGSALISNGVAPARGRFDGWRPLAWIVRGLADLARYAHPRYARAPALKKRAADKVIARLATAQDVEPLGLLIARRLARRLASTTDAELSERVVRVAVTLESAIPSSRRIDRFIRDWAPDVVLVMPVVKYASEQVEHLKSARRLGIPSGICIPSWDNLTNKGLLKFVPERVFVWNETQQREATDLHGVPAERVVATGAQLFDEWFERKPSTSSEEFAARIGIDPVEPYVLYLCSSSFISEHGEVPFVLEWIEALRSSGDERLRRLGIVVRPHPVTGHEWSEVDLTRFGNAAVWPRAGLRPVAGQARADFFDTIAHSAAVVGINTTAMIEAAIVGKTVLTVLAPRFAQESTLHFRYLLAENGGFLHVATSLAGHLEQLAGALDADGAEAERRLRFVEAFVRPRGLGRPATPILADAIEELVEVPVLEPLKPASLLLRVPLSLEAGLNVLAIACRPAAGRIHRSMSTMRRRAGRIANRSRQRLR